MKEQIVDYINEHVFPSIDGAIEWLGDHQMDTWHSLKSEQTEQLAHDIATLTRDSVDEKRYFIDDLHPREADEHRELIELVSRLEQATPEQFNAAAQQWIDAQRAELLDELEAIIIDEYEGDFEGEAHEDLIGELRSDLAIAQEMKPRRDKGAPWARHIARAWAACYFIEEDDIKDAVSIQYINPLFK